MKILSLSLLIFCFSGLISCTRQAKEKATLKIKLPEKMMSSKTAKTQSSNSLWQVQAPSSVTAADCFAVYANQPDLPNATCTSSSGENIINVNKFAGMLAAGSNLEIELTPGKAREIGVIAFKSATGSCQGMMDGSLNPANFSAPLVVGKVAMDLVAGTTEVSIPVTTSNAKSFESCNGDPLIVWPSNTCTPTIAKMVSTGSGELSIEGSCLTSATSLEILNSTTSEKTAINIISKTANVLKTKLSTNLTMNAGVVYKLIMNTANAQVVAPISLQIGGTLAVYSGGTKIGNFLTSTYNMSTGSGFLATSSSGQIGTYFSRHYKDPSGTSALPNKFYLYNSIISIQSLYANLSAFDMLNANIITPSTMPSLTVYFTGTDCTGDLIISTGSASELIKGNIVVIPTGCTYDGTNYTCTGHSLKKITSSGSYQSNVAYQSSTYTNYYGNNDVIYCQNNSSSLNGLVIPAANLTNLDGNDLPSVIDNVVISQ